MKLTRLFKITLSIILPLAITFILCQATCKKTTGNCVGKPIPDCMCTMEYKPVCGCDGKVYGNACTARCAGVSNWKEGDCK